MEYYLISTAGYPNFGDEMIVRTWLKYFKIHHPEAKVTLDVPFPARAQFLFANDFENIIFVDTVWNAIYKAESDGASLTNPEKLFEALEGNDPRNSAGINHLMNAQSIHLLGGGYFSVDQDVFTRTYLFFPLLKYVKDHNPQVKLFATGLGLTPISSLYADCLAEKYVPVFDYFGVRDQESAKINGTQYEVDDVFMAKKLDALKLNVSDDNPDILLSISSFSSMDDEQNFIAKLIKFLERPENQTKKIGVLEAMIPDDNWLFFSDVWNDFPDIKARLKFYGFWDIWQKGIPYKKDQLWVTTRFHYHLVGALLGVKGTAVLLGDDYYATKHNSLSKIGTGWQILALDSQTDIKPTSSKMGLKLLQLKIDAKMRRIDNLFID
ncbi:hypothetical protein WOSG25_100230 [Weissella oryzae SG25]|uniref:Polysaccharide pyruvyl transferase domain-containing protein n=1 Tax=Weissella oryzae (strain DSM 25784 / JCM 18191 / LMG 30913 / SG25) TaxID=1329250 RepID=A0A069CVN7_WEIOS|nr:polysaccharide pyruvyl transferase family protein [Weissella oryzae]GAK31457.1 hypothetical protein WOSG25_100230 [Weissella oryzae SG25]